MPSLIFFGTPMFALPSLEALARDPAIKILAVVTQPDKPQGRSLATSPSPVAIMAERMGLPVIKAESFKNNQRTIEQLKALAPELFAVVAYGALLPSEVLSIPRSGTLNLHPSLLPNYRGASPIQAALRNGDAVSGVTIMLLDEEMDHGPILTQAPATIDDRDTAETLSQRLSIQGAKLLIDTIHLQHGGKLTPRAQDHARATITRQLIKEDGKIDWGKPAIEIDRLTRAYHHWPGTWTSFTHQGRVVILKVIQTAALHDDTAPHPPGTIVKISGNACAVTCGNQTLLRLDLVQPAGKKPMPGEAFMNGYREVAMFN